MRVSLKNHRPLEYSFPSIQTDIQTDKWIQYIVEYLMSMIYEFNVINFRLLKQTTNKRIDIDFHSILMFTRA